MKILWTDLARDDDLLWQQADRDVLKKINLLIKEIRRSPFKGIGKPEPLKGNLKGWWSRRITGQHRLQGKGDGRQVEIVQCRFHC